jgi:excisionase family DNA binding protein
MLYTVSEVADILRISRDTVIRRFENERGVVEMGDSVAVKRRYRQLRIPKTVLDRFIATRTKQT